MRAILCLLIIAYVVNAERAKPNLKHVEIHGHANDDDCDEKPLLLKKITEIKIVQYIVLPEDGCNSDESSCENECGCDNEVTDPPCATLCFEIYQPVCASDIFGTQQVYGNQCELEREMCLHPENQWQKINDGECTITTEPCPVVCTKEYFPMCAVDLIGNHETFGNDCFFEMAQCNSPQSNWQVDYYGACSETTSACGEYCPEYYLPLCASIGNNNQQTFSNDCFYNMAACNNPGQEYSILYYGECGSPVETPEPTSSETTNACGEYCPEYYLPLCASIGNNNQQTFSNDCFYNMAACNNPGQEYSILYYGECGSPVETTEPTSSETTNACGEYCPEYYLPLCASIGNNNNNLQTFSNDCFYNMAACNNPGQVYSVLYYGECGSPSTEETLEPTTTVVPRVTLGKCPEMCPMVYSPVCGTDKDGNKQTFGNSCEFGVQACQYPEKGWISTRGGCNGEGAFLNPKIIL